MVFDIKWNADDKNLLRVCHDVADGAPVWLDSVRTLTANIAAEFGEAPAGSDHYRVLFLTGTLLFLITFSVNLTADLVIRGVRRK